jgi:hypothetical protein
MTAKRRTTKQGAKRAAMLFLGAAVEAREARQKTAVAARTKVTKGG